MEQNQQPFQVLCVSDIDHVSREEHLWQAFAPWVNGIRSIRLIRDINKPFTLTHAYVNFTNHADAKEALEHIQPLFINSSYCRVVPFDGVDLLKPPRYDQSGGQGVFIKNLDVQVTAAMLWGFFMGFGTIIGCRIAIDEFGMPRGFAYITYETQEQATAALQAMDGQLIGRRRIFASQNLPKSQRGTRVFVKFEDNGMPKPGPAEVRSEFEKYGALESVSAPRDPAGELRGFAFATFREHADAIRVIEEVKEIIGVPCTVDFATNHRFHSPADSRLSPSGLLDHGHSHYHSQHHNHHHQYHHHNNSNSNSNNNNNTHNTADNGSGSNSSTSSNSAAGSINAAPAGTSNSGSDRMQVSSSAGPVGTANTNLFVRPLAPHIRETDLEEEFKKYGKIISTKVMFDPNGNSRGFGFVSFEDARSAEKAANYLNGSEKWGQTLYVAPAQSRRRLHQTGGVLHPHHHSNHRQLNHLGLLPGAIPGGIPGTIPGGIPGPIPGAIPGAFPGAIPGGIPGSLHGTIAGTAVPGAVPGLYYIPVEYAYDYSSYGGQSALEGSPIQIHGSMNGSAPMNSSAALENASMEELGEILHPHVLQHRSICGNLDLASKITGILLQQPKASIISWLENPMLMDLRIQQGFDAYNEWRIQKNEEERR